MPAPIDIFISLRFGEAIEPARSLRAELKKRGIHACICEVPEGQNIKKFVVDGLDRCSLVLILGTKTYGHGTVSFSTYEEMEFVISEGKPFFLVKMCERFEVAATRFNFGDSCSYFQWIPQEPIGKCKDSPPAALVANIATRLAQCRPEAASPHPDPAPAPAPTDAAVAGHAPAYPSAPPQESDEEEDEEDEDFDDESEEDYLEEDEYEESGSPSDESPLTPKRLPYYSNDENGWRSPSIPASISVLRARLWQ